MPDQIVSTRAIALQANSRRIREELGESDAMPVPPLHSRWSAFWDICWRGKVTLGLMAIGLVLQVFILFWR